MKHLRAKNAKAVLAILTVLLAVALAGCAQEPLPAPGIITGRVYLDENADAHCDVCDCDFYMEGITIQLYPGNCGGAPQQTTSTDAEGIFTFTDLTPGEYCIAPKVKMICEGFKPTTPIMQKVSLEPGMTFEVPWFGFDHNLDLDP